MPKFVAGDDVYVGGKKLPTEEALTSETAPTCGSPAQEATNTIFRFTYDKPIFKHLTVESTFKAAFKISTDGTNFVALNASDTVTIDGKVLIITLNSAITGATNKFEIAAGAVEDIYGNLNPKFTTGALTAQ